MALPEPKSRLDFILQITNYFQGHWEDPNGVVVRPTRC